MSLTTAFRCLSLPQWSPVAIALFISFMLAGCGFHIRGSLVGAAEFGSIFVDAERDLSIAEEVREALIDSSFTLAANRDSASILLRLDNENQNQRVVSVTSDGTVSEVELTHAVNMLIAESDGGRLPVYKEGQLSNLVEVSREFTSDETGVLGKQNEARILRDEMKRDLVRQIILRSIASLGPSITS